MASEVPSQMQATMSAAPVVPVSSAPQANASSKSQDTKASSSRSKPKAGLKRGTSVKLEEKCGPPPAGNTHSCMYTVERLWGGGGLQSALERLLCLHCFSCSEGSTNKRKGSELRLEW